MRALCTGRDAVGASLLNVGVGHCVGEKKKMQVQESWTINISAS